MGGFFYISILSTILGVIIHYVVNLSAIAQKDLFIVEYMGEKMSAINMQEDPDIIITIARTYEILNKNPEELLN